VEFLAGLGDGFEIFDRPIHEHARAIAAGNRWHERTRARGENQHVVFVFRATLGCDAFIGSIDGRNRIARIQLDAVLVEELARSEREVGGGRAGEILGEVDAVIGQSRLFREHGDRKVAVTVLSQRLQETLTDHAVPHHDNSF
jgi:hypothetical protein